MQVSSGWQFRVEINHYLFNEKGQRERTTSKAKADMKEIIKDLNQ